MTTMLRITVPRRFMDSKRKWLQDYIDQGVVALSGASKEKQLGLWREYDRYLSTLAPDNQTLASCLLLNEALKDLNRLKGKGTQGDGQDFQPSQSQKLVFARLGTVGNGNENRGDQDADVTLEELVAAAALDMKQEIGAFQGDVGQIKDRIAELEQEVAEAQAAKAAVEAAVAGRDQDNAALREENKELGETITFLQARLESIEAGEAPKVPSGGLLGKIRDKDKHWKTQTPGVTFRETKDGNHYYVTYKDPESGKTKREAVGYDYDQAIERKVELDEQAKVAA